MEDKTNETPITSTVYGEAVKGAQTLLYEKFGILILFFMSLSLVYSKDVYVVKSRSQSDLKVWITNSKSQADFLINISDTPNKNEYIWRFVKSRSQADLCIFFVDSKSQADLIVYYVDRSQVGRRK